MDDDVCMYSGSKCSINSLKVCGGCETYFLTADNVGVGMVQ